MAAVLLLTSKSFWSHAKLIDQPSVAGRVPEHSNDHQQGWERRTDTYSCSNILSSSVQAGAGRDFPAVTSAIAAALTESCSLNKDSLHNRLRFYVLVGLRNKAKSTSLSQLITLTAALRTAGILWMPQNQSPWALLWPEQRSSSCRDKASVEITGRVPKAMLGTQLGLGVSVPRTGSTQKW